MIGWLKLQLFDMKLTTVFTALASLATAMASVATASIVRTPRTVQAAMAGQGSSLASRRWIWKTQENTGQHGNSLW